MDSKTLLTEPYLTQVNEWPQSGKHILAQYDNDSIFVYQAYTPAISDFAAEHQHFGGEFSFTRMSWIKPNFLWMMYRSGWGTKPGQEVTLAVRLKRSFFDNILQLAVASNFRQCSTFETQDQWKQAVASSNVRLQWDPDHNPTGAKEERKAIQLGLRNETLREYGCDAVIEIIDISGFVAEQRKYIGEDFTALVTPKERIYMPASVEAQQNIGLG